jgi:hypothetical protein
MEPSECALKSTRPCVRRLPGNPFGAEANGSPLVLKELAVEGHDDSIALWGFLFGEVHREVDRAHDPVAELDRR